MIAAILITLIGLATGLFFAIYNNSQGTNSEIGGDSLDSLDSLVSATIEEGTLSHWGIEEADRKLLSAIDMSADKEFVAKLDVMTRFDEYLFGPAVRFSDGRGGRHTLFYNRRLTVGSFYVVKHTNSSKWRSEGNGSAEDYLRNQSIPIKVCDPTEMAKAMAKYIQRTERLSEERRKADSLENIILGNKNKLT